MQWRLIYPAWRKLEGQTPFHLPPHGPVVFAAEVPSEIELEFVDDNVDGLKLDDKAGMSDQPDLVALSIMLTAQLPRALEIAAHYRSRGVPVLAGGISAMLHRKELADHVDSIFLGEVEGRLGRVANDLRKRQLAPVYDYLTDFPRISSVGTARRDILNRERYIYRGVRMVDLVHASRGCRFNCFPCCTPYLGGRQFRPRPIEKVVEEVQSIDNNRLFFVDNSFAQDHDWQEELFKALIPLKRKWICHPIENDGGLLDLAYEAGCWYVYQAIFDTSDVIRQRVINYQQRGIAVEGTIILGMDDHDEDYIKRLVDFLLEIGVDLAEFTILTPFPHSPIRAQLDQQGRILSNDWARYTCDRVVFEPKMISPNRLQDMYYYAWDTFYQSTSQNLKMAELLRKTISREMDDGTYQSAGLTSNRRRRRAARALAVYRDAMAFARELAAVPVKREGAPPHEASVQEGDVMAGDLERSDIRPLIAIPTFNNRTTLRKVVQDALAVGLPVIVVNDGSTDGGPETVAGLPVEQIDLPVNQGKGAAISEAGRWADTRGFTHLITLDADGQHDPRDVNHFVERIRKNPLAIIIGKRDLSSSKVPRSSRFGRAFSNFWLRVACGVSNPDSQSGFRAYPVEILRKVECFTRRYDFEIEVLVRSVWAGAALDSVDVSVHYDDKTKRGSHFRMWRDNTRISLLNTRLVARNLLPWPHRLLIEDPANGANRLSLSNWRGSLLILLRESSSPRALAAAAALGVFLGTLPFIACHCVVIVFCATRLRLNRLVALNVSHLCAPPFVPALAIEVGFFARNGRWLTEFSMQTLGRELHHRLLDYFLGSLIVGPILALAIGSIVFLQAWFYQRFISRRGVATNG